VETRLQAGRHHVANNADNMPHLSSSGDGDLSKLLTRDVELSMLIA
jgi:hypothetical protein